MDSTLSQGVQALAFLYCGVVVGVCGDLAGGVLRRAVPTNFGKSLCDVIMVLVCTAAFAVTLFLVNGGRLRLFAFAVTALGVLLERGTLHALFARIRSKRIHKVSMEIAE